MKKHLLTAALMVLPLISPAPDKPRLVSRVEAEHLVLALLPTSTKQLPQFGLNRYYDPDFPRFYFFSVMWAGRPGGSAVIGHYAVDSLTGDVWNAVGCFEESNASLKKLQSRVRVRMGLSQSVYGKIKSRQPPC